MNNLKLLLIGLIGLYSVSSIVNGKIVNCYYGTWANYRPENGKFDPSYINPKLCTHISYSFFGIGPGGEFKVLDEWLDLDDGLKNIKRTIDLKKDNPDLKVLAVVGGWNEGSKKYSDMAADAKTRKDFIQSALKFILKHGFDGLDLDWEYPGQRGGSANDKVNFVTLLKEIKETLEPHNLELGIAVAAAASSASISYDIPNVAKYVDFINVMTYDFAGAWDGKVGFNAPLDGQKALNVKSAINYWLEQGAPASKLNLGLAFYGRTFTLSNAQKNSVGDPITGAGTAGPYTRQAGYMGYNEICSLVDSWTYKWSTPNQVPYIYNGNQWIGYDNVESIGLKVDFAKSKNLGGVMIWSIETDDFRGKCGPKYPLLKAINEKLGNSQQGANDEDDFEPAPVPQPSSPPSPVKPSSSTPASPAQPVPNDCSVDGFFVNPNDCKKFYRCVEGVHYDFVCSEGLYFDESASTCNHPNLVQCNN